MRNSANADNHCAACNITMVAHSDMAVTNMAHHSIVVESSFKLEGKARSQSASSVRLTGCYINNCAVKRGDVLRIRGSKRLTDQVGSEISALVHKVKDEVKDEKVKLEKVKDEQDDESKPAPPKGKSKGRGKGKARGSKSKAR